MGLKRPSHFRALAAIEPAIQPTLKWEDVDHEMFFWFNDRHRHERYGDPIDTSAWESSNPASIAAANADAIKESGVKIFLECADQDYLKLHRGAEVLHRVLWDNGIQHEYRVYHGVDHVRDSIKPRIQEGLRCLSGVLSAPKPDPEVTEWRKDMDYWRHHGRPRQKEEQSR